MLENFNEDKRKNSMTQFSDFHTGWSITFHILWLSCGIIFDFQFAKVLD